jgi:Uma2 family endonuclease
MVADNRAPRLMSVEEWRELERTSEVRHEYIDGYVYAMAGGTLANTVIAGNITSLATQALGDRPRLALMADAAARTSESRYTYPDVVITCEGNGIGSLSASEVNEPLVIFEVLSESTEHYDRTRKFSYYRACPSLQEYVLVSTEYRMVEVYRRTAEGWGLLRFYGFTDTVELATVDVVMPVAAIYRRTDVPETLPEGAP